MCERNGIKYMAWLLLCLPILFNSCIEDEETVPDDYCYISSVSLGSVKRVLATRDTVISSSYTATSYAITIDQKKQTIENRDSLLYGTDLRAALVRITYDGSYLAYRPQTPGNDAAWTTYSPTDSIDLRTPLELYLISNDAKSSRIYTLKINVHQQEGDSISWTKDGALPDDVAALAGRRAVTAAGSPALLGRRGTDIMAAVRSTDSEGTPQWELEATDLPDDADLPSVREHADQLYVSCADGTLYSSADAVSWTRIGQGGSGLHLAAVTEGLYYALMGGRLYSSPDATDWTHEEELDEKADSLPTTVIGTLAFTQPNGNRRLVMVGRNNAEGAPRVAVWNKMWYGKHTEAEAGWMFVNWTRENSRLLPVMENTNLHAYDDKCLAFGGDMAKIYVSNDYGLTWRTDSGLRLPAGLGGAEGTVTSAVDADNVIWIIAGNQVWRGRLNRLGFAER